MQQPTQLAVAHMKISLWCTGFYVFNSHAGVEYCSNLRAIKIRFNRTRALKSLIYSQTFPLKKYYFWNVIEIQQKINHKPEISNNVKIIYRFHQSTRAEMINCCFIVLLFDTCEAGILQFPENKWKTIVASVPSLPARSANKLINFVEISPKWRQPL